MGYGGELKKAREAKRLSQQEVADMLDISQKTLSNIESDRSCPTIIQLAILGEIYELNIIEILSNHGINLNFKIQNKNLKEDNNTDTTELKVLLNEKDKQIKCLVSSLFNLTKNL